MNAAPAQPGPDTAADMAADAEALHATQCWIERVVIGLNLCPFARAPFVQRRVRLRVSRARQSDALLGDLREELLALDGAAAQDCETTLLIHPHVLRDFAGYNQFLGAADDAVAGLGLAGALQIASFHPDYHFADAAPDAIENFTNRSPYPMLHLLRESSIARAVAAMDDPGDIYRRNIARLRQLGLPALQAVARGAASG